MNFVLNRLDNLNIMNNSYEFIPESIKEEIGLNGMLVGSGGKFLVKEKDIMLLLKSSGLKELLGINMYDSLMRKPMMIFLTPTQEDEFDADKETLDNKYGLMQLHFNNFAQAFSIACWFIKDSCVSATYLYWLNMFNGYNIQAHRDMSVTLSDGTVAEIELTESEVKETICRMYEIYKYFLPDESKMGCVKCRVNTGTMVWEVDKAISSEGRSFARALLILQEARRTGVIPSKIEKYCSILECLYAIKEKHKMNIAKITASYIGGDEKEKEEIISYMRAAYGIRSDSSHGDTLKYLKENDAGNLKQMANIIDDYVRRVFRKVISDKNLNYDSAEESKERVRKYFQDLTREI